MEVKIGGIYQHYKGKRYRVITLARHSETLEELVVYEALYENGGVWARPKDMFCGNVNINGSVIKRFTLLE